jgi:hypothetical protein
MKLLSVFFFSLLVPVYGVAQMPPVVKEGQTIKLSEHVFVIPDELRPMVPNVGIVVGTRATLIVDPGLGARSGEAVMRESAKAEPQPRALSRHDAFFIRSTPPERQGCRRRRSSSAPRLSSRTSTRWAWSG